MPGVFVGHGSPMHALSDKNTKSLVRLGREIGSPGRGLHLRDWMTEGRGTHMEAQDDPRLLRLPQELFAWSIRSGSPGRPSSCAIHTEPAVHSRRTGAGHGAGSPAAHVSEATCPWSSSASISGSRASISEHRAETGRVEERGY